MTAAAGQPHSARGIRSNRFTYEPIPRRLLIVTAAAGSLSRLVVPQLAGLADAGWDVEMSSAPDVVDDLTSVDTPFHPIDSMTRKPDPIKDFAALRQMLSVIHAVRPQIVMGGTPKGALVSMSASRIARTPVRIFHARGARWEGATGISRRLLIEAERISAACSTDVLAVSDSLADLMVADGVCRARPTVLGSGGSKGVDLESFTPRASYPEFVEAPVIGVVGRLTAYKGMSVALDVFDAISRRFPLASLVVIGGEDPTAPLSRETWQRLKRPRISVLGRIPQSEVATVMRSMDLLVFPSSREGLPNAVIESAASGVPAVGWDVTGVRDAIAPGQNGALVGLDDVGAMIASALEILSANRALTAVSARDWASNFDAKRIEGLLSAYLESRIVRDGAS